VHGRYHHNAQRTLLLLPVRGLGSSKSTPNTFPTVTAHYTDDCWRLVNYTVPAPVGSSGREGDSHPRRILSVRKEALSLYSVLPGERWCTDVACPPGHRRHGRELSQWLIPRVKMTTSSPATTFSSFLEYRFGPPVTGPACRLPSAQRPSTCETRRSRHPSCRGPALMSNSSIGEAGPVWVWKRQNLVVTTLPCPPSGAAPGSHQLLELDQDSGSPMTCQSPPRQRSANGSPEGRNRMSAISSSTYHACTAEPREPGASGRFAVVWCSPSAGCAVIVGTVLILCPSLAQDLK
jgi:hypothetical protein